MLVINLRYFYSYIGIFNSGKFLFNFMQCNFYNLIKNFI